MKYVSNKEFKEVVGLLNKLISNTYKITKSNTKIDKRV